MIDSAILEALQKATIAAVAASDKPAFPVKYVGQSFKKPTDASGWLEVVFIPNNIQNEFWDEGKTYQGLYRLIMHWPIDARGAYAPMKLLESIAKYFTKGLLLADPDNVAKVKIQDHPNLTGMIEEAPEQILPLSIRYECFKA